MIYLVDRTGVYLGAWDIDPNIADSIPVDVPPEDAKQVWQFPGWSSIPVVVDLKLIGVEFEGVMCSATKEDMWGLSSVAPWIQSGNSTAFEFDNGNVLVLTPENYRAFYETWASFRASFFNKVD